MNKKYCLTLKLKDDPDLIRQYEEHHEKVWPEVISSIKESGVLDMEIYRLGTSLCMVMEVNEAFSFEKKAEQDKRNETVQRWEELMWKYQEPLAEAAQGEKWMLMNKIFDLNHY